MQHRAKTVASIFFLCLMLNSCAYRTEKEAEAFIQNYQKVKIGMTRQQVREVVGKPDRYSFASNTVSGNILSKVFDSENRLNQAESWDYNYPINEPVFKTIEFDLRTNKVIKLGKYED